jgi:IclR family pca regulon transcriptional regulator
VHLRIDERPAEYVQSLERGLKIIRAFSPRHPRMTLTEIAERTRMPRSAARRFLLTLESLGYVRLTGRYFSLSPAVLELGYSYLSSVHPWDAANPLLERLSDMVDENVLAGVLDGTEVVCVARTSRRLVTVAVFVGGRVPAHASSMGRAILAYLPEDRLEAYFANAELTAVTDATTTDEGALRAELARVRSQGWATAEHELERGLMSVSAPVFGDGEQVVAAINVSAHGNRIGLAEVERRIVPPLLDCAREVSLIFGARQSFSQER